MIHDKMHGVKFVTPEMITGLKTMTNGKYVVRVKAEDIQTFLNLGYWLGRSATPPKPKRFAYVTNGEHSLRIKVEEFEEYAAMGYTRVKPKCPVKAPTGVRIMHKDGVVRRCPPSEVEELLAAGWKFGCYSAKTLDAKYKIIREARNGSSDS